MNVFFNLKMEDPQILNTIEGMWISLTLGEIKVLLI